MAVAGVKAYLKARPHIQVTLQLDLLCCDVQCNQSERQVWLASIMPQMTMIPLTILTCHLMCMPLLSNHRESA